jgi:hypothetical protein
MFNNDKKKRHNEEKRGENTSHPILAAQIKIRGDNLIQGGVAEAVRDF